MEEFDQLFENLGRILDGILNRIFNLRPRSAIIRRRYLILLFIGTGFLLSLRYYPLTDWANHVQDMFVYLLNPLYRSTYTGDPFSRFLNYALSAYLDPRTFQYLPIALASFFIALQCAALYLADVFELEDIGVARKFIWQVALSGSNKAIRISEGYVLDEHKESPIYLIGGPGRVIVDLDSVALFEKPDGTPNIIGPTGSNKDGMATLDGFERFRAAINLRDHFTPLSSQEKNARSIPSRSLDGIRVTAVDMQIIFSVYRGDSRKESSDSPEKKGEPPLYPYSKDAVRQLIYNSTSKVSRDSDKPSIHSFIWEVIPPSMVRSELAKFMSGKNLTEFLASYGAPEVNRMQEREIALTNEEGRILPPYEERTEPKTIDPPPPFTNRPSISDLFNQFESEFAKNANKIGVQFRWTGVGTWRTMDIVPENHIDAWKLIRENAERGKDDYVNKKGAEAGMQRIIAMIQDVPLTYQAVTDETGDREAGASLILEEYRRQLKEMDEFLKKNIRRVPPTLVAAIAYLQQLIFPARFIQRTVDLTTDRERELYDVLLEKIGESNGVPLSNVIAQLIDWERQLNPTASLEQILENINRDWDLDMEGKWSPRGG
jgi:hypothetical protein